MKIVNVKSGEPYDIYCGRYNKRYNLQQSKWANPYVIGKDGEREEVIEKYRLFLNCKPDLLCALPELKGKTLGCWCDYPKENCHCSILIDMAESRYIKNWFSNMLPFEEPLVYQGISYFAAENFYQAMKMPKDKTDLRAQIAAMSPYKSKTAIRDRVTYPWRDDWTKELSLRAMRMALNHKFKEGTLWRTKLNLTENWEIVEWNNWGDVFWGKDIVTRQGENNLGKILMDIRDNGSTQK